MPRNTHQKKKESDWLSLIGEVGASNAPIAAIYLNGDISYRELSGLIGEDVAEKIRSHVDTR